MRWWFEVRKVTVCTIGYALLLWAWGTLCVDHRSFLVVWVPLGVAAAAVELWGIGLIPSVFIGSLLGFMAFHPHAVTALPFALCQTLAVWLVHRFSFSRNDSKEQLTLWVFTARAFKSLVPAAISSAVGIALVPTVTDFSESALILGLVAGLLVITPAICIKLQRHFSSLVRRLKDKNAEMAAIARTLPDTILIQDLDGNYLERFSEVGNRLTNIIDALPERNIRHFFDKPYVKRRMALLKKAWKSGKLQSEFLTLHLPDNGHMHLEVRVVPFRNRTCIVMVRDVTAEKIVENELSAIEVKSASVLEAVPDMMFLLDIGGDILQVISHGSPGPFFAGSGMVAHHAKEFVHPAYFAAFEQALVRVSQTGIPQTLESLLSHEGNARWFELRMVPYEQGQVLVLSRDIDQSKKAAAEATEKTELLNLVSENIGEVVILRDAENRVLFVSPSVTAILGYAPSDVANFEGLNPLSADNLAQQWTTRQPSDDYVQVELEFTRLDGQSIWLETTIRPITRSNQVTHYLTVSRDITFRKNSETRLRIANLMVNNMKEGLLVSSIKTGEVVGVNPAFLAMTGYSDSDVQGRTERELIESDFNAPDRVAARDGALAEKGDWHGDFFTRKKDGTSFPDWRRSTVINDADGMPQYLLSLMTDMRPEQEREELIWRLSHHDTGTGLPNKAFFLEILDHACNRAKKKKQRIAVFTAQMARLRLIAENIGPEESSELMRMVALRITALSEEFDGFAYVHDNEFCFMKEDCGDRAEMSALASRLSKLFEQPFRLGLNDVYIHANIGIAVFPDDAADANRLRAQSAIAVLDAIKHGPTAYRFYSSTMGSKNEDELRMEGEFRKALNSEELVLHYQPKIALADGRISGFEALSRWTSPRLGKVNPDTFIPLAEKSGLIVPLGNRTLREAVSFLADWKRAGHAVVPIAVNLSLQQVQSAFLAPALSALLAEFDVEPELLEVEITETSAMSDTEKTINVFRQLRDMGVGVVLDDFGTGYSSLSHLKLFPLTSVKIDKSFVQGLGTRVGDAFCEATITLAKALGLQTVAEGVETEEQRVRLKEMGCDYFQGYLFSAAVTNVEALAMLRDG